MKNIERMSKAFDFSLSIAKSKLTVDQKKVDEIETEVLNFLSERKAKLEKLDSGCKVITVDNTKDIV